MLLSACQKEPVEPDPEQEPEPAEVLAEAVIGTTGGTLEAEGFRLSVPPGAFESEMTLSLSLEEPGVSPGANQVTGSYRISGIDQSWSKPITLELKYGGSLEGESYVAIGYSQVARETKDTVWVYDFLDAVDSAGFLKTMLHPIIIPEDGSKSAAPWPIHHSPYLTQNFFFGLGISKMATHRSNYAEFRYNAGLNDAKIEELGRYFDEAVFFLDERGLIGAEFFMVKKLKVAVLEMIPEKNDVVFVEPHTTLPSLKADVEMFKAYADLFRVKITEDYFNRAETRDLRMKGAESVFRFETYCLFGNVRNWLHYALNYWMCETFYGSVPDPGAIENLCGQSFLGVNADIDPDIQLSLFGTRFTDRYLHGVGMSPLLKYLMEQHNPDKQLLNRLYLSMIRDTSKYRHIDALIESVEEPEYVWWPGFMKEFLTGSVWPVKAERFMNLVSPDNTLVFSDESDTVRYFDHRYPDLSAKLCRIDLSKTFADNGLNDGDKLKFALGPSSLNLDYVSILLFNYRDEQLRFLDSGSEVTLGNVKALIEGGDTSLLAVVVNSASEPPYSGDLRIEMTVSVEKEMYWPWKYLSIDALVTDAVLISSGEQESLWEEFPCELGSRLMERSADGTHFTTRWLEQSEYYKFEGGIDLYIDTLTYEITGFSFWSNTESLSDGTVTQSERTEINSREGETLPVTYLDDDFLRHRVRGEEVCVVIESWSYAYRMYPGTPDEYSNVLESYSCLEDADLDFFWERVESK